MRRRIETTEAEAQAAAKPVGVFVYGTLKRGFGNHHLVEDAEEILEATTPGVLYDLPYGFPAMVLPEDAPRNQSDESPLVHGELCIYPEDELPEILRRLDFLEGYYPNRPESSLYLRILVKVQTPDGRTLPA